MTVTLSPGNAYVRGLRHEVGYSPDPDAEREEARGDCANPFCDGFGNIDVSENASGRSRTYGTCEVGPHGELPEFSESVDALIAFKDSCEDTLAGLIDRLAELAGQGSAADQCTALYALLGNYGVVVP